MITGFLKSIFGDRQRKNVRRLQPLVDEINSCAGGVSALSDEELAASTKRFRLRLALGETTDRSRPWQDVLNKSSGGSMFW